MWLQNVQLIYDYELPNVKHIGTNLSGKSLDKDSDKEVK